MTVRVGVTGHRSAGGERLLAAVGEVLEVIAEVARKLRGEAGDLYAPGEPRLRVVSALAEGADRMVASAGRDLHFELECPLPFAVPQYDLDFASAASKKEFHELLASARSVRELDGVRGSEDERARAYEAAGRTVLRHCDVLIAIWDGELAQGTGGTGQIVGEAVAMNLPVVRIQPAASREAVLLARAAGSEPPFRLEALVEQPFGRETLAARLRPFLLPPGKAGEAGAPRRRDRSETAAGHSSSKAETEAARRYLGEQWPRGHAGLIYDLFRGLMTWPGTDSPTGAQDDGDAWEELRRSHPRVWQQIDERFATHASWPDALAKQYAGLYRSSTVALYLMGAAAVLVAFLGVRTEKPWLFLVELCVILTIVLLTLWGRRQCWHQRWIDYRLLAEELRQMAVLALLARVTSSFQVPAHLADNDPSQTWFTWHFRAVVREAGLVGASVDGTYLGVCERVLTRLIRSQVAYHGQRAAEMGHLRHRLHHVAQGLFILAGLACIPHWLLPHWLQGHPPLGDALGFAGLVLPAFAAALAAIASQGELERIEARSRALESRLVQLLARQERQDLPPQAANDLGRVGQEFADVLLAELVDWRFVFLGKPIELPA